MRIGNYKFNPNWIPSTITVLILPILVALGFWQLSRAEEKRYMLEQRSERLALPEFMIESIPEDLSELEHRRLVVKGHYLNQYPIYIDNKVYQGQVGYQIVLPLQISDSEQVILINRGWLKATESRSRLPEFTKIKTEVLLNGVVKLNSKDVASLGSGNRLGNDWPALVRWIDPVELDRDIPGNIASLVFLQDPVPEDGLKREWKFINSPPEKNISYAMQWFSLAGLLLIIYIVVNTKRLSK
ncbi:Cytochrome oxidase biogenesis protein Surf1, facilitates heme A insertion [hydrothermal vent metagenome]|uniref:Cytochrome oxidase biogenesis protein Surf1, facilitates heme A insertion n=1 Tax=hydrothermal vent metagenome TaxID=652676 RepID=A0A3B1ANK4_9ZZZZ